VFLSIQSRSINIDYLTEVYNRKRLDGYIKEKISSSQPNKTFSAIMVDMDNFKFINDNYGHDMGDNVLKISAGLLKKCIGAKNFIARYGGDEFCLVLDISNEGDLNRIISKIKDCVETFNKSSGLPCSLELSMGYAVYDYNSQISAEDFEKHIDVLMYENKKNKKRELVAAQSADG